METVLCISRYGAIGPPFAMWLPGITETCIAIDEISKATSILNFLEAEHYGDIAESTIIIYVSFHTREPADWASAPSIRTDVTVFQT
jgi:hypothetical protein